jgi:poly(A) polymerase Pap1
MTEDEVTMTHEQFNKLSSLLEKISEHRAAAIHVTDIVLRMMPAYKKVEYATICKAADDITKIKDTLLEIGDLMKNVKDNHIKETGDQ